jgi:transcriptional regulator with XRE-family HTH domain
MQSAGQQLRAIRERLGLTMRDVESGSSRIANRHGNEEFAIPPSRLSDIETKGVVPSIYRTYSLAVIYRQDARDLLSLYGVDFNETVSDLALSIPPKSHLTNALHSMSEAKVPVRLDPSFDLRRTTNLGRMVEQWGLVPLAYLSHFASHEYTYGYIGSEDYTMHPLLPPGTFVQVDESKNRVVEGTWRSEYERPIYFIETREGYACCWCSLKRDTLILQPHPLSPVSLRVLKHPQEAEVIGQVVGMAMRLDSWQPADASPEPKARTALN